jgi:multicomponent Na+:H+ antiporter subunit E
MRAISLGLTIAGFWLALSGHYTPFLLTIGAVSVLVAIAIATRMGLIDSEGHPVHLLPAAMTYIPWLLIEILKSSWAVTKTILAPSLPISPTMTVVRASQRTNAGLATYANSITLTPGTITVSVRGDEFIVHALRSDGADDLEGGGMDARVQQFEGGK